MMSSWIKPFFRWFIQQRSTGAPISGPLLQEKAKHFSTQLNTETVDREFKASTGWLEKFKTRHGIRNLSIQGEKLSAAEETVEPFLPAQSDRGKESDPRTNLQCRRNWTFVEVFAAKNSCFLSRKICSRIQKSKGSFNCAGLYKCYWNSQTKTRPYWEICEAEML